MPDSSEEPVFKRKRVHKACQPCRLMKVKCDGKKPLCSRCQGYGYACAYPESRSRQKLELLSERSPSFSSTQVPSFGPFLEAIGEYDKLLQSIASELPVQEKANVESRLALIKERVESAVAQLQSSEPTTSQVTQVPSPRSAKSHQGSQRYLGEVSDVRFFNLVRRVFQENSLSGHSDEGMDSYEQDDIGLQHVVADVSLDIPSPEIAEGYLDIYFQTIHIAYPFIPRSSFLKTYERVREFGITEDVDTSWLALLYIVFAIGAYYTSFPGKGVVGNVLHMQYFQRALSLSSMQAIERSLTQVMFLLAQCFYLLAVCRTDSCWTTLGLAVRTGQSIGLHVETDDYKPPTGRLNLKREARRRVWYSMYVLDRLLALQLGRPPAIHDDDCQIPLPSRIDETDIDWEGDSLPIPSDDSPSGGDYFVSTIAFSRIVGYVLRGLYGPRGGRLSMNDLQTTRNLDGQLLAWKSGLPRTLRFDLGHTFDRSITFKRQRNKLAIKFHHLRALIHRPYLCLPLLSRLDQTSIGILEHERNNIVRYERICVSEAQETAHLLHNVADERDLVHDFPWWQMISCLICASSILIVASVFAGQSRADEELDPHALNEDAETCLKVFEALSTNSDAARIARDMMKRLKDRGVRFSSAESGNVQYQTHAEHQHPQNLEMPIAHYNDGSLPDNFDFVPEDSFFNYPDWPSEISDSMQWSAQFFEAAQHNQPPGHIDGNV